MVQATIRRRPAAPSSDRQSDEGPDSVSVYLVVPYFATDRGRPAVERPLSAATPSWLCPSMVVNNQPGVYSFTRGAPTTVTVDVANWGAGTSAAPVYVQVWWSDPATGFAALNLFGQAAFPVPSGGKSYRSPAIVGTIPTTAPAHVCLLARVTSPLDMPAPGTPIAPANDRHCAQLNLAAMAAAIGQPFHFMFWAGNPFDRAASFKLIARPVTAEPLRNLQRLLRRDVAEARDTALHLRTLNMRPQEAAEQGDARSSRRKAPALEDGRGPERKLQLEPGGRRAFHLVGMLPRGVEGGSTIAVEVIQIRRGDDDGDHVTGSLGLIITARR